MKKKFFPVFMDLTEKKIVVIGGGNIATRRIKALTEFTSDILVVAPEITETVEQLVKDKKISWLKQEYSTEHLAKADIVIAATNQTAVNHKIFDDARDLEKKENRRILVNVIDDKKSCDFYFPGIVQNDDYVIGISSCGESPSKTKQLRKNIEEWIGSESIY